MESWHVKHLRQRPAHRNVSIYVNTTEPGGGRICELESALEVGDSLVMSLSLVRAPDGKKGGCVLLLGLANSGLISSPGGT